MYMKKTFLPHKKKGGQPWQSPGTSSHMLRTPASVQQAPICVDYTAYPCPACTRCLIRVDQAMELAAVCPGSRD